MNKQQIRDAGMEFAVETLAFIEGQLGQASEEVRTFLQRNGVLLVRVRLAGRDDLETALLDQLDTMTEVQRLRANAATWELVKRAVRGFLSVAVKMLVVL